MGWSNGRKKKEIDPNLKPEEVARQAYARAIRILGPREHTTTELRNKLSDSGFDSDVIEATLERLISQGYQSDERFANLYAEQLLRKHNGPMSISAKLGARGIDSSMSREAIAQLRADWPEVAADALRSRFSATFGLATVGLATVGLANMGSADSGFADKGHGFDKRLSDFDQAEIGKYARFLNRRGFSSTDSIKAIRLAAETVSE